jgi:death-on-curing protein
LDKAVRPPANVPLVELRFVLMRREVSINRLAKSAGVDPEEVVLALIDRGIEIDDPEKSIEGATWKAARAIIKELRGGRVRVRAKATASSPTFLDPAPRSSNLVGMLSVDDVLFIHERLCVDFASTSDPIDPPGLRSKSLLESAVNRQHSGYGEMMKYHDPVLNAATLLYGICNDHPFYNGNKRTALVSALAHLDCNHFVLGATKQNELFRLMIAVADHSIIQTPVKIGRETEKVPRRGTPDEEVKAIASWFRPKVVTITRGENSITYRELRQILANFNFKLDRLKSQKMSISALETRRTFFLKTQRQKTRMVIRWPGDGKTVPIGKIKDIRQTLNLCEEDGVTRDAFYAKGFRVDQFINAYRIVLRKLASR